MASGNSFSKQGQSLRQQPSQEFVRCLFGEDPLSDGIGFYFLADAAPLLAPHTHDFGFATLSRNGEHTGFIIGISNRHMRWDGSWQNYSSSPP
jgi:hypothetical protein